MSNNSIEEGRDYSKFLETGVPGLQEFTRLASDLAIFSDTRSRLTTFQNGLTIFRSSINSDVAPEMFIGTLISRIESGWQPLWSDLLDVILNQPDISDELRKLVTDGAIPNNL